MSTTLTSKISPADTTTVRRILAAIDGSDNSKKASTVALRVAERLGAELIILNVLPGITYLGALASRAPIPQSTYDQYFIYADERANEIVNEQVALAKDKVANVKGLVIRTQYTIVEEIISIAEREKVDLIVMGTRGLGGFKKLLMGSVSSGVVNHAHCSVLVVR